MAEKNGGSLLNNNPRLRRVVQTSQNADDSYRRQRERNNFVTKQSKDRQKLKVTSGSQSDVFREEEGCSTSCTVCRHLWSLSTDSRQFIDKMCIVRGLKT
ncbi:hypothetical protein PYW08_011484 [Mythimna loreyi]|uniref:Uncharacterized protein n=1 Tax=Mythimna loreyi TaxID=667449 RepID=A0ACC2QK19_9NEOP|nr:hypothetical protein PYW08_011484 [Mythimna loreyi]